MVDNPIPEQTVAEVRLTALARAARLLIAGHEFGAVRRIVLYVIAGVSLLAAGPIAVLGLTALLLLALTDQLA